MYVGSSRNFAQSGHACRLRSQEWLVRWLLSVRACRGSVRIKRTGGRIKQVLDVRRAVHLSTASGCSSKDTAVM